ncbi:MAG: penicillin-binding protein activator [Gammaproteobacteria bacterium]|nr:penicillin-binding protein activator [Gammaproteobacteria bacterium]NNJ84020.1 penicillin-binding protein activator [Gammaproteobacteria bacterium]
MRIKITLYILVGLIIAGCQTVPDSPLLYVGEDEQAARALMAAGRFKEAADKYLRMADQASQPRAYDHMLAAAGGYLDAEEPGSAEAILARIDTAKWTTQQRAYGHLLTARVALAKQRPEEAFVSLEKIYSSDCRREEIHVPSHLPSHCNPDLPRLLWPDFFRTRSLAYAGLGGNNAFNAVRDRIALDMLLTKAPEIEANHRAIWSLLSSLSPSFLSHAYLWPGASQKKTLPLRVRTLQGWLTLASIIKHDVSKKSTRYSDTLSQALISWRKRHPDHPAGQFLLEELAEIARDKLPVHIALLLPLDGNFSGVATAIHDGFLSAWLRDNEDADRPTITIHNTVGADIQTLYSEAIDAGAEFVVGPLDKPSVARLTKLPVLPQPTLTLNHAADGISGSELKAKTTSDASAPLYQFTLAPESEAKQIAERARLDGHTRAAILTPETQWGQRMEDAFTATWQQLGGAVVDSQGFSENLEEISTSVQQLVKNTGHREPVSEDDDSAHKGMDCILMAAFPREARQLLPQLKFHYAGDVPIYASSHIFSGIVDPVLDQDIDDVVFGDMPWVLQDSQDAATLRSAVMAAWPESAPKYLRYYALGIDAYRIIPRLKGLRTRNFESFKGETGELSVDSEGRVNRTLLWARIYRGKPVIFP